MAKPLRSDNPNPESVQFRNFGVLDTGKRSKGAAITSISINVALALVVIVLGMVVKKNPQLSTKIAEMYLPPKPPEQPKPKPPPPPPKKLPEPPKIEPPKIKMPEPKIQPPPEIKPVVMPKPAPVVITPPAPKKIDPPPAPKVVSIHNEAAHVPNHDAHPTAVHAGYNMINTANSPAVATRVNIGGGIQGMPSSNTGNGPRSTSISMGSGAPNGTNVYSHAPGAVKIAGIPTGVPGGTGTGRGGPVSVAIAGPSSAPAPRPVGIARTLASKPTLLSRPNPVYTAEARAAHIEGTVTVRIRVNPSGTSEPIAITHSLGHGLDESARQVVLGMRWKPALDNTGQPTEWTGEVNVVFAMS